MMIYHMDFYFTWLVCQYNFIFLPLSQLFSHKCNIHAFTFLHLSKSRNNFSTYCIMFFYSQEFFFFYWKIYSTLHLKYQWLWGYFSHTFRLHPLRIQFYFVFTCKYLVISKVSFTSETFPLLWCSFPVHAFL